MAPHSSTLAWKIPWTEEPGRLQSMGPLPVDTTERLHFHFSLPCTGEGNGNPLQCSCLENPRDRGAWWAAIYGVAQSQTPLKWLSSSILQYKINFFKKKQIGANESQKLLHSRGNHKDNDKTTNRPGGNICKWWDRQGISIQNWQRAQAAQYQKTNPIKKWIRVLHRRVSKTDTQMATGSWEPVENMLNIFNC